MLGFKAPKREKGKGTLGWNNTTALFISETRSICLTLHDFGDKAGGKGERRTQMQKKDQTEGRILKPTSPTAPPGAGAALMLFLISALTFQRYAGEVALCLNAPVDASSTLNHLPRFRFNTLGDFNGPLARSDAFGSTAHASCSRPLSERCAWGRQVKHDWIHSRRHCRVTVFRVQLLLRFFSCL